MCQVSIFFLGAVSEIEVQSFSVFPIWLPHHVTYDVIIIIKTFYKCNHTNGENFVSIRQAVAAKNTKNILVSASRSSPKSLSLYLCLYQYQ